MIYIPISSSGHCPRALSAKLLSYPSKDAPKWLSTAAEEGNLHEDAIKAKLRNSGLQIDDNRNECTICKSKFGTGRKGIHVEYETSLFTLVGHLDGIITENGREFILEVKSMSQYEFDRWMKGRFTAFPYYADQLTCYMNSRNINFATYIVKNRNSGYIDNTFIDKSPSSFSEIIERLTIVVNHVNENKLVECEYQPESLQCHRCSYSSLCLPEPKVMSVVDIQELQYAIDKRKESKSIIYEQNGLIGRYERTIKDYLLRNNQTKMKFSGWSIALSTGVTTTTYPKDLLIQAGVTQEQMEFAKRISEPYDRLYLKDLNKDE